MKLDYVICLNKKEQKVVDNFVGLVESILDEMGRDYRGDAYEQVVNDLMDGDYRYIEEPNGD